MEADAEFSAVGRAAMSKIRRCLTSELRKKSGELNCDNAQKIGFASHSGCYVASGYCELTAADKSVVLRHGKRLALNPKIWALHREIRQRCRTR